MVNRKHKNILPGAVFRFKPLDRRRHPRIIPNNYLVCNCIYKESGKEERFSAKILNMSEIGILLMSDHFRLYPHDSLEIIFNLPLKARVVSIRGKVARAYRREPENNYCFGIEFDGGNEEDIKLLLGFIKEN